MHQTGRLVAEPIAAAITDAQPVASEEPSPSTIPDVNTTHASSIPDSSAVAASCEPLEWQAISDEILLTVKERLPGISALNIGTMSTTHGAQLPAILDLPYPEAIEELKRCKRIGPKTAEKLKKLWDASSPAPPPPMVSTNGTPFGLHLTDLEASPPSLPFEWGKEVRCYLPRLHSAEVAVAESAGEKAALGRPVSTSRLNRISKWIKANQTGNGVELSQGQCAAIQAASDAPLLVVTGGPGCGKTTVVQAIVKLWSAQGKLVHICAPTGRAAQRMGTIQGIEPSTIHRLLRYQPRGGTAGCTGDTSDGDAMSGEDSGDDMHAGGYFEFGPSKKLISDAVLVDEASMLSLPLAAALMQALTPKTQLILVGDVDQLPPIGPGGVLHSLIASGLAPVVDLREVFRQAAQSSIVTSALAVRHGDVPKLRSAAPTAEALLNAGTDALVVRAPDADAVPATVYKTVGALAAHENFAEADLQVITPMKKGPTGSLALNLKLQDLLNPPALAKSEVPRGANSGGASAASAGSDRVFRVGDRVLQLVNNYDKEVFNGDQGYIVEAFAKDRTVVVNYPYIGSRAGNSATNIDSNGDTISATKAINSSSSDTRKTYHGVELNQLELAYAVTVHKAQGGEAKHVIMALSPQHGRMLTRRLLYTGLTRAKDLLVIVAPEETSDEADPLTTAVRHKESDSRRSWLTERLQQEVEGRKLPVRTPEVYSNEEEVLQSAALVESSEGTSVDATTSTAQSSNTDVENKVDKEESHEVVSHPLPNGQLLDAQSLCGDLNIVNGDAEAVVDALESALAKQQATLVCAPTVHAHLDKLRSVCQKHELGSLPSLERTLRLAPLLLVASPEYFDRGLAFADRLGPMAVQEEEKEESLVQGRGGLGQVEKQKESLVDQLRRVMGAVQK